VTKGGCTAPAIIASLDKEVGAEGGVVVGIGKPIDDSVDTRIKL